MANSSHSVAGFAGVVYYFSFSAAARAGFNGLNNTERTALLNADLAAAAAFGAGFGACSGFCAGSVTIGTTFKTLNRNFFFTALCGLHKGELNTHLGVVSADRAVGVAGFCRTAKTKAAENIAENIIEIAEISVLILLISFVTALAAAIGRIYSCMAKLVIAGTFLFIGKDFIGFAYFLEFRFGGFIIRIKVRVIFFCHFAVGFFYFVVGCAFFNAKDFVIIALIRHFCITLLFFIYSTFCAEENPCAEINFY